MKRLYIILVFSFFLLLLPINAYADKYTRSSGMVTFTAPKSKSYQWYVKKKKKWKKIYGENRRKLTITCYKHMNGYKYKCKLKRRWTKPEKLFITDINKRYHRSISVDEAKGLFMPKCADGYCYIYCANRNLTTSVKSAIQFLNGKIGMTFIYTDSPHIADIIIVRWYGNVLEDSIWLYSNETDVIRDDGIDWAGVSFSENGLHYLVAINDSFFLKYNKSCQNGVIIHELGHCIGISHSNDQSSIMYPSVTNNYCTMTELDIQTFREHADRIRALQ